MKTPIPVSEVMAQVQEKIPSLVPHMYLDGEWIWYCGPSLAGAENKETREALKEIGFRFCFNGHVMKSADGQPTSIKGSWGHSCAKPMGFRRRRKEHAGTEHDQASAPAHQLSDAELLGSL